jgi:RimJ/RimL family protein N-acetyltransferase
MNLLGTRVALRQWIAGDISAFAAMNADAEVMKYFPQPLTFDESLASFEKLKRGIEERGWGLWAVEIDHQLAGLAGLAEPGFEAHFTPCIEIGWRFHRRFWGQGYALEASHLALRFAFENLHVPEVVALTARPNERSQRLMQRLGMTHSPRDDFEHPKLPVGHALRSHVLYRIQNTPDLRKRLNQALTKQGRPATAPRT